MTATTNSAPDFAATARKRSRPPHLLAPLVRLAPLAPLVLSVLVTLRIIMVKRDRNAI
jgi:hypothetical protein